MMFTDRFSQFRARPFSVFGFLIVILIVAIVSALEQAPSPVPTAILLFFSGTLFIKPNTEEFTIYSLAFGVSVSYSIFLFYYYIGINGAPYFNVPFSDDSSYERDGLLYAELLGVFEYGKISPLVVQPTHNSKGYVYFIGLVGKVVNFVGGGYHTLIPRFINSFLHAFSAIFVYRLCQIYISEKRTAFILACIFACFPHVVYLSGHIYRDTFICFAFAFSAYKVLKIKTSLLDWLGIVLILIATSQVRFFSMAMLLVCIGTSVVFVKIKSRIFRKVALIFGAGVTVALLLALTALSSTELEIIQLLAAKQDHYTSVRTSSSYSSGIAANILLMDFLPFGLFARVSYLVINPLPFLDLRIPHFINGLGTLIQAILFFFSFIFTLQRYKIEKYLPLFTMLWGLVIGIAITSFQLRHMVMFYPFLFVLGGLGYTENHSNKRLILNSLFFVVSGGIILVWLYMKIKLL